jgi:hypothetical protein
LWRQGQETLGPQEYFNTLNFIKGNQVLFAIRAGSLFLNERVTKLAPERGALCRSCCAAKETPDHFLSCPKYSAAREAFAEAWGARDVTSDPEVYDTILHGALPPLSLLLKAGPPPSCRAALEPSPATSSLFLKMRSATSQALLEGRARALYQMWDQRNASLGASLASSQAQGYYGSGVKAVGTTDQIRAISPP